MSHEHIMDEREREVAPATRLEVAEGFASFIPTAFQRDPLGYFEREGQNIKPGDTRRDETGRVREDPTAVKVLPIWSDGQEGKTLRTVGKRVSVDKGAVAASADPFYEYRVMETVRSVGLPAPRPVARVEQGGQYLIVMEKAEGVGWYEKELLALTEKGWNDAEVEGLKRQAEERMQDLARRFEEAGIVRPWKLNDMVFDVDIAGKCLRGIVPTDWERAYINAEKLEAYQERLNGTSEKLM